MSISDEDRERLDGAARELGFRDARHARETAVRETIAEDYRVARQRALDELEMIRGQFWQIFKNPGNAVTKTGKPVTGDDGKPVPDRQVQVPALHGIRMVNLEMGRLLGLLEGGVLLEEIQRTAEHVKAHAEQVADALERERRRPASAPLEDLQAAAERTRAEIEQAEKEGEQQGGKEDPNIT